MSDKNTVVMHEMDLAKTSAKQKVGKVVVMVGTYLFLIIVDKLIAQNACRVPRACADLLAETGHVRQLRRGVHYRKSR